MLQPVLRHLLVLHLAGTAPSLASRSEPDGCTIPSAALAPGDSIVRSDSVVWHDPGPVRCPVPQGLDAGVCVRGAPLARDGGGDIRCLPSFVIIGIQKAATRELMAWLNDHPSLSNPGVELTYLNSKGCDSASLRRRTAGKAQFDRHGRLHGLCGQRGSKTSAAFFWRGYMDRFPPIPKSAVPNVYTYEKTPGYFEMKRPQMMRLREVFPSICPDVA